MRVLKYKNSKYMIKRQYKVGGVVYVDIENLNSGKVLHGIKVSETGDLVENKAKSSNEKKAEQESKEEIKQSLVAVSYKDSEVATFRYPSDELDTFIKKNNLNENMVINCINNKQKTHKGYTFDLVTNK